MPVLPMTDQPLPGDVWAYPYLWARQASQGETEGRKDRPVAVAVSLGRRDGLHAVYLLAVTSQSPAPDRPAIEIPETEKRRANLSADTRLWIMLDEYNVDVVERSFYLTPDGLIGRFGDRFLRQIQRGLRQVVTGGRAEKVGRSDD